MDLSRRRVDKKLPIYIGSFFLSPLLLDLMSVPTKWNKVCCCSGHSERSGRYLNTSLTQLSIAMMVVRHPQIWTVSFLMIIGVHTDPTYPYHTLYKSNFEPEVTPRIFYHGGIPLLLPPSRSCLGIPDQIYCLEVRVGQDMKLSFCLQFRLTTFQQSTLLFWE